MQREHLQGFVDAYSPGERHKRVESERFKRFTYDELVARDKTNFDISWLADDSLEDPAKLPDPATLIADIALELQDLLGQVAELAAVVENAGANVSVGASE
jgi:type I restriction enzyme M protein